MTQSSLGLVTDGEVPDEHIGKPVDGDQLDPAVITHLAELESDLDGDGVPDRTDPGTTR